MGREGHGDFDLFARFNRTVKVEENAASADILRLGEKLVFDAAQPDSGGKTHIEATHGASVLGEF
jgi:hypothetical protein